MTIFIVDASHHDEDRGPINWSKVRASGIDVIIHKATEGDPSGYHFVDPKFQGAVASARAAGMALAGGYHCLAHGDAASWSRQVDLFIQYLNQVGGVTKGWAMIDVEPFPELKSRGLSPKVSDIIGFEAAWKKKTNGFPLAVYLPKWYWEELGEQKFSLGGPLVSSDYPVSASQGFEKLYARAGGDHGPGWGAYDAVAPRVWQFASTDQIPGITGNCDCNAFKGTLAEFVDMVTGRTVSPPTPVPTPPSHPVWPGRTLKVTQPQMHGDDVKTWQTQMKKRGWTIAVDGFYGPASESICKQFQGEKKLNVDGEVGKITWDASFTASTK